MTNMIHYWEHQAELGNEQAKEMLNKIAENCPEYNPDEREVSPPSPELMPRRHFSMMNVKARHTSIKKIRKRRKVNGFIVKHLTKPFYFLCAFSFALFIIAINGGFYVL